MVRWWRGSSRGRRAALVIVGVIAVGAIGGTVVALEDSGGSGGVSAQAPSALPPGSYGDYDSSGGSSSGSAGDSSSSSPELAAPSETSGAVGDAAGGAAAAPVPPTSPERSVPIGGVDRQLVRTAQLTVELADPAAGARQVRTAAAAAGGMVVEEQSGIDGSYLVLRVPSESLDRVVDDVALLGRVLERSGQVSDATEEVVDLDARVRTQQASVDRVRALLAQATTIGEVTSIESEVTSREAELNSLTARLATLRDQVSMSTLTIDLRVPAIGPPPPPVAPDSFSDGLASGLAGLAGVGSAVAVVVGFVLPLLPLLVVALGIGWVVRRVARARRSAPAPRPVGAGPAPESPA